MLALDFKAHDLVANDLMIFWNSSGPIGVHCDSSVTDEDGKLILQSTGWFEACPGFAVLC